LYKSKRLFTTTFARQCVLQIAVLLKRLIAAVANDSEARSCHNPYQTIAWLTSFTRIIFDDPKSRVYGQVMRIIEWF
jgi:hypothetical protein